ncbi:MAG: ABC transporter substrate-binding protein [Oscillospiraceae bacterium]
MKKILSLILTTAILLSGCASGGTSSVESKNENDVASQTEQKYKGQTLKLYNWGEYTGEHLIENFEKQTGAKVIIEYFDSNEMMYTKVMAGDKYDILVPSDYIIEKMLKEKMLMKLDKSKITNIGNLTEGVKNLSFDPENDYSVPYLWGSVGIVYNSKNVPEDVVEEKGFSVMKDEKYKGKIYMYDSERDSFMIAFKALGFSTNTENEQEIEKAYQWLVELNNTMEPIYVTDEVIDGMMNGNKDLAVVYSGDAAVILDENEDMRFSTPKEGTNIWCDSMVIPANAENPDLAHEFINYVLTYEASFDNANTVGYASPNDKVLKDMSTGDGIYADNEAFVPRAGFEKDETFKYNEILKQKLSELWIKVKASK